MQRFMITLGSMSLQASVIIVIALVLRRIFEKLHIGKKYMMLFWLISFFCLVCPFKVHGPIGFWRMSPVDVAVERVGEGKTFLEDKKDGKENSSFQEGSNSLSVQTPLMQEGEKGQEAALLSNMGTDGMQSAVSEDTKENGGQNTASVKQNASDANQAPSSAEAGPEAKAEKSRFMQWFSSSPVTIWVLGGIWLFGMLVLLAGNIVRYVKLKGRLLCSIKIEKQVYIGDEIGSPIVVGFFRPRIYLPSGLPEEYRTYVLEHERTHIRRGDMFVKMIAYIITCIHWFNPIVWYGFYLFGKDMEMACDEETVRRLGIKEREAYAKTLLDVAEGSALKNKIIFVAPVAFEEGDVKSRIKNIMQYRKTITVLAVCAVAVCILAVGLFFTKTGDGNGREQEDSFGKRIAEAGKINLEKLSVKKQADDGRSQYFAWIRKIQDGMLENFKTVSTEELGIDPVFMNSDKLDFNLGYEFVDLDVDGVYELVLGGNMKSFSDYNVNPVYGIYGLREGEIVPVLEKGEEEDIFLCKNGAIAKRTGSSQYSYYQYYTYQEQQLHPVETLIYDNNARNSSQAWFYGKGEVSQEDADLVKPAEAKEIQDKYQYENLFFQVLVKKEKLEKAREAEAMQIVYPDREDLTFADLNGLLFLHTSGTEGWYTELIIKPDGSFEGVYQDGDGISGYHYKYTEYECYFSGKFSNLTKSGPYEYTMKCTEFQMAGTPGEESIQGETLVKTTEPYGFMDADEVRLYLPGKLESELPDAYVSWCGENLEYGRMISYGLFNEGDGSGYSVYMNRDPVYDLYELVGHEHKTRPVEIPEKVLSEEEIARLRKDYPDREDLSFSELTEKVFRCSQIGEKTFLNIEEDGTFYVREETERRTLENGAEYPKGTIYLCLLKGKFSNLRKTDPYKYMMKCQSLKMEPAGKEWIQDGYRYIAVEKEMLGFEKFGDFELYLPGARVTEFPEGYFRWNEDDERDRIVENYYLYNVETETMLSVSAR